MVSCVAHFEEDCCECVSFISDRVQKKKEGLPLRKVWSRKSRTYPGQQPQVRPIRNHDARKNTSRETLSSTFLWEGERDQCSVNDDSTAGSGARRGTKPWLKKLGNTSVETMMPEWHCVSNAIHHRGSQHQQTVVRIDSRNETFDFGWQQ